MNRQEILALFHKWEKENNIDFEELLSALSEDFERQSMECDHAAVRSCLMAVAGHLKNASFDFYVSTK